MKRNIQFSAYLRTGLVALALSLPIFASCRIDGPDRDPISSKELAEYARRSLISVVALPVEALEMALELDEYMSLSEEERMTCGFNDKYILHPNGNDLYIMSYVSDKVDRTIRCQFTTGGKSIREPGNEWIVDGVHMQGYSKEFNLYTYQFQLPEGVRLCKNTDRENTWTIKMNGGNSEMELHPKTDSLYTWTVNAQGSETSGMGVAATFATVSGLKVRETVDEAGERTNVYSGQFNVEISRDGKRIDYCHMSFVEGVETEYKTSR